MPRLCSMCMGSPRLPMCSTVLRSQHTTLRHDLQVPSAATVYCQPIQIRCSNALGFSVQQANRWRWRPDYEGVELACNRSAPAFPRGRSHGCSSIPSPLQLQATVTVTQSHTWREMCIG